MSNTDFVSNPQCLETIHKSAQPEASELIKLLSQYEIEGVLWAHDTIAQDVLPQDEATTEVTVTLPVNDSSMYNTDQHPPNITIINIEKTNEPLVRHYYFWSLWIFILIQMILF